MEMLKGMFVGFSTTIAVILGLTLLVGLVALVLKICASLEYCILSVVQFLIPAGVLTIGILCIAGIMTFVISLADKLAD